MNSTIDQLPDTCPDGVECRDATVEDAVDEATAMWADALGVVLDTAEQTQTLKEETLTEITECDGECFKECIEFDGITINGHTREVIALNQSLALTAREFDLLLYLAQHPQQVFSRMQLLEAVWGYTYSGYEHTVNSHINRLRGKLTLSLGEQELVKTVWGVGYKFSPPKTNRS